MKNSDAREIEMYTYLQVTVLSTKHCTVTYNQSINPSNPGHSLQHKDEFSKHLATTLERRENPAFQSTQAVLKRGAEQHTDIDKTKRPTR